MATSHVVSPEQLLDNPAGRTLKHNLALLAKAVSLLEARFTTRAIRAIPTLRRHFQQNPGTLAQLIRSPAVYPVDSPQRKLLLDFLGNPPPPPPPAPTQEELDAAATKVDVPEVKMEDETAADTPSAAANTLNALADKTTPAPAASSSSSSSATATTPTEPFALLPESDIYVSLLVVLALLDSGDYAAAQSLSHQLITTTSSLNRRTLDQLSSRLYFYWVRAHELAGAPTAPLRTTLLAAQRTAALRNDDDLQATLLPLLLRNYLDHNLYDQADRLVAKTTFPSSTAGNAQLARWYYYIGRIRAVQLNYTEAHTNLQQAIRRAPNPLSAPGFLQTAHKLSIVVELLMGEIPERKVFRQPVLKGALTPYLEVVQSVRVGDMVKFNGALERHREAFDADKTTSLILRLRHNVLKTALRTLSLAYSRIPLADVAAKLNLESSEDAEYIVAKAIRDGVVDAVLERGGEGGKGGVMRSKELGDVYATGEVQKQFDERIRFLLELHKTSVKAMRYPLNAHSKELASAGEARERERELVKEIEDADEDGDIDGPGDMDSF